MTMYIVHIHTILYYVHMPLVVRALDIMHLPYIVLGVNIHTCIVQYTDLDGFSQSGASSSVNLHKTNIFTCQ